MKIKSAHIHRIIGILLLVLVVLYYSRGIIIPEEGRSGALILLIIISISFVYLFKLIFSFRQWNKILKLWTSLIVLTTAYYIFSGDHENDFSLLRQVYLNFLPFFPFYFLIQKKIILRKHLVIFFLALLPILILSFYQKQFETLYYTGKENMINNAIYSFLGLIPFAFLLKRRYYIFGALMLLWFFAFQANKRSAVICVALSLFLFFYQELFISEVKYRIKNLFFAGIIIAGVFYAGSYFFEQNTLFQQRFELMLEGDSANRDILVTQLFNSWYHSDNFTNYFFGLGFNSSEKYSIAAAHNDWIDFLGSYGLMGILFYCGIWYTLIKETFKAGWDKKKKMMMYSFLLTAFLVSMTSRWYIGPFPYMNFLILPYLLITREEEI